MKRMKILPVLAVVIGSLLAFAFKAPGTAPLAGERWYFYNGGDINKPINYSPTGNGGMDDPGCNSSTKRCAVLVLPDAADPTHPDKTSLTNVPSSNVRNKP